MEIKEEKITTITFNQSEIRDLKYILGSINTYELSDSEEETYDKLKVLLRDL